jgi:hypothetical protein
MAIIRRRIDSRVDFMAQIYIILYIMSTYPSSLQICGPASLIDCFGALPDPRVERTREHRLIDVVVIGFCATLAGGEGFTDMEIFGISKQEWFKTFLELPNGIPSHDTFNRVFQALDPRRFAIASCAGRRGCGPPCLERSWLWTAKRCAGRWTGARGMRCPIS